MALPRTQPDIKQEKKRRAGLAIIERIIEISISISNNG